MPSPAVAARGRTLASPHKCSSCPSQLYDSPTTATTKRQQRRYPTIISRWPETFLILEVQVQNRDVKRHDEPRTLRNQRPLGLGPNCQWTRRVVVTSVFPATASCSRVSHALIQSVIGYEYQSIYETNFSRSVRFSGTTTVDGVDGHFPQPQHQPHQQHQQQQPYPHYPTTSYDERCYDLEEPIYGGYNPGIPSYNDGLGHGGPFYPDYHTTNPGLRPFQHPYDHHQQPGYDPYCNPPPLAHHLLIEDNVYGNTTNTNHLHHNTTMASTAAPTSAIGAGMNVLTPGAVMPPPPSLATQGLMSEDERKIVTEFCHLLEKSKQLFNGLRDLPQYGHKQWQAYFGRTFDIYTKLWKFQQQHRIILDSRYGLKRWQIGEIASKIGQLYYHY